MLIVQTFEVSTMSSGHVEMKETVVITVSRDFLSRCSLIIVTAAIYTSCLPESEFDLYGFVCLAHFLQCPVDFNLIFIFIFRNSDKDVEIAFLGTRTGLTRVNLFVGPEQLTYK